MQEVQPLQELVIVKGEVETPEEAHGQGRPVVGVHRGPQEVQEQARLLGVDYQPQQEIQQNGRAQEGAAQVSENLVKVDFMHELVLADLPGTVT